VQHRALGAARCRNGGAAQHAQANAQDVGPIEDCRKSLQGGSGISSVQAKLRQISERLYFLHALTSRELERAPRVLQREIEVLRNSETNRETLMGEQYEVLRLS